MRKTINLMIADDHVLLRDALANAISDLNKSIKVIGKAENGAVLINLIREKQPDILILDMQMPVLGGEEVLAILAKDYPDIRTIILSMDYSETLVVDAVLKGAAAYLPKACDLSDLMEAIANVHKHGFYFNKITSKDILIELASQNKLNELINPSLMSAHEIEVLKQLCSDQPHKIVADKLNITARTLYFHKYNLLKKTNSSSMIALVKYAIRNGIISLND
jgi:DNA-binding NarL/FixJ family response regulator